MMLETVKKRASNYKNNREFHAAIEMYRQGRGPLYLSLHPRTYTPGNFRCCASSPGAFGSAEVPVGPAKQKENRNRRIGVSYSGVRSSSVPTHTFFTPPRSTREYRYSYHDGTERVRGKRRRVTFLGDSTQGPVVDELEQGLVSSRDQGELVRIGTSTKRNCNGKGG